MASGHVSRINRPNTWLHRPSLLREESPCQLGAVHTWHFSTDCAVRSNVCCWGKNGHGADIAKVNRFSLLFARRFPVTPKLFPVNFREHFRREPAWMLRLATILFLI